MDRAILSEARLARRRRMIALVDGLIAAAMASVRC